MSAEESLGKEGHHEHTDTNNKVVIPMNRFLARAKPEVEYFEKDRWAIASTLITFGFQMLSYAPDEWMGLAYPDGHEEMLSFKDERFQPATYGIQFGEMPLFASVTLTEEHRSAAINASEGLGVTLDNLGERFLNMGLYTLTQIRTKSCNMVHHKSEFTEPYTYKIAKPTEFFKDFFAHKYKKQK